MATRTQGAREIERQCREADPRSTVEHFVVCSACGQIFDCRDQDAVRHHSAADHSPSRSPQSPIATAFD